MKNVALGFAALAIVAAGVWYWSQRPAPFPAFVRTPDQNILIVTIDTLRADALGSYGGKALTPNLDRLAASGVRFDFAHAHAVVTLPSHTSIFTGRYPFDHGVRDNSGYRVPDDAVTLAEIAKARGYATGAFVGAFPLNRQFGLAQGFDVYDDLTGRQIQESDFGFVERPAAEVVAAARAWIQEQKGPWLAWVHVFDPHSPYAPPPPYNAEYADSPYAGEVAYVDSALEPLLSLARAGARPATVVVTADHGEALGDHGELTHGLFAYESTLRVPLIVAQVGRGAAPARRSGAVSDTSVRHVDILPTIAELAGLALPTGLPGRSLVTPDAGGEGARPSYFESMAPMLNRGWAPLRGVLAGRDKYIDLPIEELYDLAGDPAETKNLAPASGERARALFAELERFGSALPGERLAESAEVRERLRSLGYVSGTAARKTEYREADDPKRLIEIDNLMMSGIEAHQRGRVDEGMDAYRRVIAARPDMNVAYQRLAFMLQGQGRLDEAIAILRQGLDANGPTVDLEVKLGTYLAEAGRTAEAIALLDRVTAAAPGNVEALNARGIAYARAGRPADALESFQRILEIDPRDAFALENAAAMHLERGELAAAAALFQRAAGNDPRSSRARAGLGIVALRAGRQQEAFEHWRAAIVLDPRNFDALFNLATGLIDAGRPGEARPYVELFVRTAPPPLYGPDIARLRQWLGR